MSLFQNTSKIQMYYHLPACTVICLVAASFSFCIPACADTLVLKDSRQLKGKILEETTQSVKIQTTNAGILTIPRDRVESVTRESQSPEEVKAEDALLRGKPYDALKIYEEMWEKTPGNPRIEQKIAAVKDSIKQQEDAQYKTLFREAAEASQAGQYTKARAKYDEILKKIGAETLTARRARRGIAVEHMKECAKFKNMIQYNNALQSLKQAVDADGTMAVAHLEYAQMLRDQANLYPQAIEQIDLAILEGKKFLALTKSDQEDLLLFEPPDMQISETKLADARYDQMELYFKSGQKQKGVEACQAALEDSTLKLPKAKMDRIVTRIGEVFTVFDPTVRLDKVKALEGLDIALKYNPDLIIAHYWKGRFFLQDDATSLSIKSFDNALEIASRLKESTPRGIYLQRAKALIVEKRYSDALESLEKTVALADEEKLAVDERYEALCLQGDLNLLCSADTPEKAQDCFSKAILLQPETPRALIGRAKVNRQMALALTNESETQTAETRKIELQERALKLRNVALQDIKHVQDKTKVTYPETILEEGRLYKDGGQTQEAMATFNRLIKELEPTIATLTTGTQIRINKHLMAEAYVDMGEIEMKANNRPSAQAAFEKALKIVPDFAKAYKILGDLAKKVNDFDSAVKYYSQAAEVDPQFPDYELHKAVAYEEWQKYKDAKIYYELYKKKGGRDPRIQSWIEGCEAKAANAPK